MKTKNIFVGLAMALFLVVTSSCEDDFLDINEDPNNPAEVSLQLLLPGTQAAMATNFGHSTLGLSQETSAIVQQLVNFRIGTYNLITGTSYTNQWLGAFSNALSNNEQIITQATASGDLAYVGIAQLQKAFMYSVLVDLFGDLPYTEALQGVENLAPRFEDDETIYNDLFRLIDEGIANLDQTSLQQPGNDDLIYGGDLTKWRRFGNSLKLKLYNQIRLVRDVTPEVTALLASGELMQSGADDFEFDYGASTAISPDNRHPGYTVDYAQGSRENQINPFFYNLMLSRNDPRIPYYFYNQTEDESPQPTADYQQGRFVSVRFGSIGPNASSNVADIQTLQGLYPVGGAFDNGEGGEADATTGPGGVPQRMLTYFQTKYNEAELRLVLGLGGEREAFEEAVRASFDKVNEVATVETNAAPPIPQAEIETYVTAALARFDAAANKLEPIITEKYIASFGWGVDIYNDYRRTGFPVINDPETDNDPQTIRTGPFPLRLPYYNNELTSNPNAPRQPNIATERIFWDPS